MRYTVSKCIPNFRADPYSPPRLSYWSDDTPSGWYFFPVDIFPFRHRPSNPFLHIRRPTSLLLPSCISSAAVSIYVVPHIIRRASLPLSLPLTLSSIPIILNLHRVSIFILPRPVAFLIALSYIVPCTSPPLFVYLLWLYFLLAMCFSVLNWLLRSVPHYFSHCPLWSSHYTFIFIGGTALLSIRGVLVPLRSAAFFLRLPSLLSALIWSFPSDLSDPIYFLHL